MTTFHGKATGDHTYNGTGTNNTLTYAGDPDSVTINLTTHTVTKGSYQDSFSDIQTFIGNASAVDAIVFSGASNQYKIVDHTNGSITVTDTVAGRDGTVKLDNIQNLQFTDTTLHPTAPAVVNNSITELYVAYFDQAQDPTGEQNWVLQLKAGVSIGTIAEDFSTSSQALALYPFLANPTTATTTELDGFVTAIYKNLYDHAPNPTGETYWVNALQSGSYTVGKFVLTLINGATGDDAATLHKGHSR